VLEYVVGHPSLLDSCKLKVKSRCPSSFPSGPSWVYHEVVSDIPV
jgi:hypothetical protein